MDITKSVVTAFKQLLLQKPYGKIKISEICEHAHISRTSFYAYFSSKEDVVAHLFEKHVVKHLRETRLYLPYEERRIVSDRINRYIFNSFYAEREYYISLVAPLDDTSNVFLRVVTNAIFDYNMEHVDELSTPDADWPQRYIAHHFASSFANFVQQWIKGKMTIPVDEISALYTNLVCPYWEFVREKNPDPSILPAVK